MFEKVKIAIEIIVIILVTIAIIFLALALGLYLDGADSFDVIQWSINPANPSSPIHSLLY